MLRLLKVVIAARWRPPIGVLDESAIRLRVWPHDLDLNLHVNNARYLALMDLGRWDLLARMGLLRHVMRRRWHPLIGAAAIRFRRSLLPFQAFELCTRFLGWNAKYFFIEQRFVRAGEDVATGWIKGLFRSKEGNVSPADTLAPLGTPPPSPEVPEHVRAALSDRD